MAADKRSVPSTPTTPTSREWAAALATVLGGEQPLETVFQPIADLSRAVVVGYEALSRFPSVIRASPDKWFEQAEQLGCAEPLESLALVTAARARDGLPQNTFLTLNVSPDFLLSRSWAEFLEAQPELSRIVIEVTENRAIADYARMRRVIEDIRARGGSFAVDDAGSGYASLQHVLALRPDFVKLDRVFITDCHQDRAKSAMIEMVGAFAGRLDAWIIAEGIEKTEEMEELIRLGTPLAQGYLLGKPAAPWSELQAGVESPIRTARQRMARRDCVACAMTPVPAMHSREKAVWYLELDTGLEAVALVDEWRRPVGLAYRHPLVGVRVAERLLLVKAASAIGDVLGRAMTRPGEMRFDPLVVTDEEGKLEGVVTIDRLVRAMLAKDGGAGVPESLASLVLSVGELRQQPAASGIGPG
ncbi:MAG: EAL domain-containing protein [Bryobacterales bacterium]|nr:EAL domain-containing protein [Bryobacterales bacterium]